MKRNIISLILSLTVVLATVSLPVMTSKVQASEKIQGYCENTYMEEIHFDDVSDYTNEELFDIYAAHTLGLDSEFINYSVDYSGDHLTGYNKKLYELLKPEIKKVADGERSSARIPFSLNEIGFSFDGVKTRFSKADLGVTEILEKNEITGEYEATKAARDALNEKFWRAMGFNSNPVILALLNDCPYELYWFMKSDGTATAMGLSYYQTSEYLEVVPETVSMNLCLTVDSRFRSNPADEYSIDTSQTGAAKTTAAYAQTIVNEAASKSDYDKLLYYKNKICDLNTYNHGAADNGPGVDGLSPWQIIYVFDMNPATNVVCEGYAKAFAYLCELTHFNNSGIKVYTVTGDMIKVLGQSGGHMWNIAHMEDGKNYMVDVTNCDGDDINGYSVGYPNKLFLNGYSEKGTYAGNVYYRMNFENSSTSHMFYTYDDYTLNSYIWEELELSATNYDAGMAKERATVTTAPSGKTGLSYTGREQDLLNSDGVAVGGTLVYSTTNEGGTYSTSIPTGTNAGKYSVWYKVQGDESHLDSVPVKIEVNINKASAGLSVSSTIFNKKYKDTTFNVGATRTGNGTITYQSNNTGVATIDGAGNVTITGVGTAQITVLLSQTANYLGDSKTITINVEKKEYTDSVVFEKTYEHVSALGDQISLAQFVPTGAGTASYAIKSTTYTGANTITSTNIEGNILKYYVNKMVSYESGVTTDITVTISTDNYTNFDKVIRIKRIECSHPTDKRVTEHKTLPTCEGKGEDIKKCSLCGKVLQTGIEVAAKGHSWKSTYTVDLEPTCTVDGSKSIHCTICEATKDTKPVSALGHDFDDGVVVKAATETEKGIRRYSCQRTGCSVTNDSEIPELTHEHVWASDYTVDKEATCLEAGKKSIHCGTCDERKDITEISALGHNWSDGEVILAPTETEKGRIRYSCVRFGCDETREEELPALAHIHSWNEEYAVDKTATCTEDGSRSIHCSSCSETKDVEIIPALGHDWDDGVITKAPTYLEKGIKAYTCKNDSTHTYRVDIPTLEQIGDVVDEDLDSFTEEELASEEIRLIGISDAHYTGSAITFDIRAYKGNKLLKEGVDYSIKYSNNKNACADISAYGAPTVKFIGKGAYKYVNKEAKFAITPIDISESDKIVVSNETAVSGSAKEPAPVVTFDGKKLKKGVDYYLAYNGSYSTIGEHDVRVIGRGNFTGEIISKYKVVDDSKYQLMSKASIKGISKSLKYTGNPVVQDLSKLVVKVAGETLSSSDYTVSYVNNTEIGTASMIIKAADNSEKYAGEKIVTYKIKGTAISKAVASYDRNQLYTGKTVKPNVRMTLKDGTSLVEGTDYTISYLKNVNAGTASIIITGKGAYSGTSKKTFKIKPIEITNNNKISAVITGNPARDDRGAYTVDVEVRNDGKLLVKGVDYMLSFKNNKAPASESDEKAPTAIIKGKGNYAKTIKLTFSITE